MTTNTAQLLLRLKYSTWIRCTSSYKVKVTKLAQWDSKAHPTMKSSQESSTSEALAMRGRSHFGKLEHLKKDCWLSKREQNGEKQNQPSVEANTVEEIVTCEALCISNNKSILNT